MHHDTAGNAHLPLLFGTHLRINAGFLIALACAAGVWWLLERTTVGFEFRSVGANASASRVAVQNGRQGSPSRRRTQPVQD